MEGSFHFAWHVSNKQTTSGHSHPTRLFVEKNKAVTKCCAFTVAALSEPDLTRWCRWCCSGFLARSRPASTVRSTLSATPLLCTPDQTEEKRKGARSHLERQCQMSQKHALFVASYHDATENQAQSLWKLCAVRAAATEPNRKWIQCFKPWFIHPKYKTYVTSSQ